MLQYNTIEGGLVNIHINLKIKQNKKIDQINATKTNN
jgi:hypothetical protein